LYLKLLARRWPLVGAAAATLAALGLLWRVRGEPVALGTLGRIDALSAFFALATLGGLAFTILDRRTAPPRRRTIAMIAALLLAYSTTYTLGIAGAYIFVALLSLGAGPQPLSRWPKRGEGESDRGRRVIARMLANGAPVAPGLLAALALLAGYGTLALRGARRYDEPGAGFVLDSFAFWLVLLAATIPLLPLARTETQDPRPATREATGIAPFSVRRGVQLNALTWFLRFAWLYPLARLYSLGPWNAGWAFATVLFGGAAALWCAASALGQPDSPRRRLWPTAFLGLTLAGLGLGTSAGLAAACYTILAYLIIAVGSNIATEDRETGRQGDKERADLPVSPSPGLPVSAAAWLVTAAFPLTAPFVATWMLAGAAVAGGVALLAGGAWLVALLHGLNAAIWGMPEGHDRRPKLWGLAGVSLALGVGAPLVVRWLIQPVVDQLQGGLTPYGEINIWPWVGLAASDAAHRQVTTLPSLAVALLMLILCALVYVVARLRGMSEPTGPHMTTSAARDEGEAARSARQHDLRSDVPWLGVLLGADRRTERRRGDAE
jgi:hypothetical protein